jgi:hypothetical protein
VPAKLATSLNFGDGHGKVSKWSGPGLWIVRHILDCSTSAAY